jgi:tetratricopeptide (TPR) repeat protein
MVLVGCTFSSQKHDIQNAEKLMSEGQGDQALALLDKAMRGPDASLALEAARRGARLAQIDLKNYQKAVEYYRFLIVSSDSDELRRFAEKNIAQIYFENLLYYDRAIIEYEKLLRLSFSPPEHYQFRLNIAKSHHQLGNLEQALAELKTLEKEKVTEADIYDLEVFKGNVLITQKKQHEAAALFAGLIKKFPERAQKDNLALTLAVCYEELSDYRQAIGTLESMKKDYPHPEFLVARIARLKGRLSNMPGANGFKK